MSVAVCPSVRTARRLSRTMSARILWFVTVAADNGLSMRILILLVNAQTAAADIWVHMVLEHSV